jgi:UDP-N-acetylmuramoylalanine--D-glutamate ligase
MDSKKISSNPIEYMRRLLQMRKEIDRETYSDVNGGEHRLEKVGEFNYVEYVNDSKSTDIDATWFALEKMEKPIIWIVGGVDKGNDYGVLAEIMRDKVKAIICLGKDNATLFKIFQYQDIVPLIVDAKEMKEAVEYSHHWAKKGDVVLFSPACPSYDLYENYEVRGNSFKNAVREFYDNRINTSQE